MLGITQRRLLCLNLKISSFANVFFFIFFTLFTVYSLNNSYFIYELCSKFQQNNFGSYSKGMGIFKFEKFHLLVTPF